MSFLRNIATFAKKNWTFFAMVLVPILRFLWRVVLRAGKTSSAKAQKEHMISGETYKKGDVIDVEIKKR